MKLTALILFFLATLTHCFSNPKQDTHVERDPANSSSLLRGPRKNEIVDPRVSADFHHLLRVKEMLIASATANRNSIDHECINMNITKGGEPNDPLEVGMRMKVGADKGKCIDTIELRAPKILSDCPASTPKAVKGQVNCTPDTIIVGNFRYMKRFWLAQIPKNGVESVSPIIGRFAGGLMGEGIGAAHMQTLVTMKPSPESQILLVPQVGNGQPVRIHEFMFSADPYGAFGDRGNYLGGMCGYLGVVNRMVAVPDRMYDQFIQKLFIPESGYKTLETYMTDLSESQKRRFLERSIFFSAEKEYNDVYDFLDHNCVHVGLDMLDFAIQDMGDAKYSEFKINLRSILRMDTVTGPLRKALQDRKVTGKNSPFALEENANMGLTYLPMYFTGLPTRAQQEQLIDDVLLGLYVPSPEDQPIKNNLALRLKTMNQQLSEKMMVATALVIASLNYEQRKFYLKSLASLYDYKGSKVAPLSNRQLRQMQENMIGYVPDADQQKRLKFYIDNNYSEAGLAPFQPKKLRAAESSFNLVGELFKWPKQCIKGPFQMLSKPNTR